MAREKWDAELKVQCWSVDGCFGSRKELYFPKLRLVINSQGAHRENVDVYAQEESTNRYTMLAEKTIQLNEKLHLALASTLMLVDSEDRFQKDVKPVIEDLITSLSSDG